MLTYYIVAGAVGGLLVLFSLFASDHHGESHDFGNHDVSVGDHEGHDHSHDGEGPWIPFLSMRFWTYFAMAFGASGLLLSQWVRKPEPTAAILAGSTGLLVGLLVSFGMRILSKNDLDSSVSPKELMGKEAQVLVAIRPGQLGRVRLSVKGEVLDMLALCDGETTIDVGEGAIIVDMDGDRAKVVSRESVFGSAQPLNE